MARIIDVEMIADFQLLGAIEKPKALCSFHNCISFALKPAKCEGAEFCAVHDEEFTKAVTAKDAALRVLGFWVKMQGGHKRAARLLLEGLSHRALLEGEEVYW